MGYNHIQALAGRVCRLKFHKTIYFFTYCKGKSKKLGVKTYNFFGSWEIICNFNAESAKP